LYSRVLAAPGFLIQMIPYLQVHENHRQINIKQRSNEGAGAYRPGVYTIKDLEVTDTKSNSIIRIGMTKEELTDILGQETEVLMNGMYNFEGLHVFFRDSKVAGLVVYASDNTSNRFMTHRNVGLGTSLADVVERYGEEEINEALWGLHVRL
jgi:hypothetical protein